MFEIRRDDLSGDNSRALLALHLQGMRSNSPPESVYALDPSGLRSAGVHVWSVWEGEAVVAIGALKEMGDGTGEIKSMRTHPDHLRRGASRRLLDHIIAEAVSLGLSRLSLETGSGEPFEPALALYRSRGFVNGEPFANYRPSPFNQFLHLPLQPGTAAGAAGRTM